MDVILKLDTKFFDVIFNEMEPFLTEKNFIKKDDCFVNEEKSIKVAYDDNRKMFTLSVAEIEQGELSDYREINAWLFDQNYNEKDAVSVGMDFTISLRKEFGVKANRAVNSLIDLPSASKNGAVNVTSFAKKLLDVFPALKDEYKNHISVYGNFLYLSFYGEHLRPRLIRLFEEGTKKQIKKLIDVIDDAFTKGDKDTVNTAVVLLVSAAYKNEKITETIKTALADNTNLLGAFTSMLPEFSNNKKLIATMIKD